MQPCFFSLELGAAPGGLSYAQPCSVDSFLVACECSPVSRASLCKYRSQMQIRFLLSTDIFFFFHSVAVPILFEVRFVLRAVPRCRLSGCSFAPSEPRRHSSVPSIFALAALISYPSSACAHA